MDPSSPSYYTLLEVSPTADQAEIHRAFRRLARRYHPDVNPGDRTALERFQQISNAYQVLSDPTTRSEYDQAIHLSSSTEPNHPVAYTAAEWYQQGLQLSQQGLHQEAIQRYTQALTLNPQLVNAYNQRGFSYYKRGQTTEAFADYAASLALDDQQAITHYYRGLTRFKVGYSQGAIADFDCTITLDPDHGQAYYYRGICYRDLKEYQPARQDFIIAEQILLGQGNQPLAADARRAAQKLGRLGTTKTILNALSALPIDLATIMFYLVTQPQQCINKGYTRLPPQRSLTLSGLLLLGFELNWLHTVNSRWSNLGVLGVIGIKNTVGILTLAIIGIGLIPFMAFMVTSVLDQVLTKQPVNWQASYFLAGVALLPLYGIIWTMGQGSTAVFGISSLICGYYLLLLLYGGYRYGLQCHHAIAITSAIGLTGFTTIPIVLLAT